MAQEIITLQLKNKILSLKIKDFGETAVDTEELLQVDHSNILGDIITFPVLFNRIALIKTEIDGLLRDTQLDFDIFVAQKKQEYRSSLVTEIDDGKGKGGTKKSYPTIGEVDDAVTRDPKYKVKRQYLNSVKKEVDVIDALYWSAKSKDKKLDAISMKIRPEEFEGEILVGEINSVLIRQHKDMFKQNKKSYEI